MDSTYGFVCKCKERIATNETDLKKAIKKANKEGWKYQEGSGWTCVKCLLQLKMQSSNAAKRKKVDA